MHSLRLPILLAVFSSTLAWLHAGPPIAAGAKDAVPLAVGVKAPGPVLKTADGADFDLGAAFAGRNTLLVFYRGGWCPFCNRHLAALGEIEPRLRELGYQIIAVSPDAPDALRATADKHKLPYRLLSDRDMVATAAYGLAFQVDAATRERYSQYHIDLAPVPGDASARWLPVPAAFIVDRQGVVRFVYSNPDYKTRVAPEEILAAARRALGE